MPRVKTIQLVTPGTQRNGQTVSAAQLRDAVASFEPSARPPVSIGHPKDSTVLAFGRVDAPRIQDGALVLDIHYTPVLEALEDQGYVEGFSAGLYPHPQTGKYYIHHVAALGELPPAAETKVLAAADLGQFDPAKMITLAAASPEREMTKEEIQAAIAKAMEPMSAKLVELEAKIPASGGAGHDDKHPGKQAPDEETRTQLAAALGTIKSDRIDSIAAGLKAKGLSDEQAKPLLDLLRAADPVQLADDKPDGVYAKAKAFVAGLVAPVQGDDLTKPLELADAKGEQIDLGALARKF